MHTLCADFCDHGGHHGGLQLEPGVSAGFLTATSHWYQYSIKILVMVARDMFKACTCLLELLATLPTKSSSDQQLWPGKWFEVVHAVWLRNYAKLSSNVFQTSKPCTGRIQNKGRPRTELIFHHKPRRAHTHVETWVHKHTHTHPYARKNHFLGMQLSRITCCIICTFGRT